jgi:hypothetical protein
MARIYTPPVFNLLVDVWNFGDPLLIPPQVSALPAQIYIEPRRLLPFQYQTTHPWYLAIILRTPFGAYRPLHDDIWREQGILKDFHVVKWAMKMHPGFPNEYYAAFSLRSTAGGVPFDVGPP